MLLRNKAKCRWPNILETYAIPPVQVSGGCAASGVEFLLTNGNLKGK